MRAIFVHMSGFVGLLVFLNQLWSSAALDRTLWTAFATGIAVYLVLLVGYVTVHRIVRPVGVPPPAAEAASAEAPSHSESA